MVMSKRGGHISHLGEKSSVSRCQDPAKITGCGKSSIHLMCVCINYQLLNNSLLNYCLLSFLMFCNCYHCNIL